MKAKERRRLKQMEKLQGVDVTVEPEAKEARNSQEKTLEELIQPPTVNTKHNLKVLMIS